MKNALIAFSFLFLSGWVLADSLEVCPGGNRVTLDQKGKVTLCRMEKYFVSYSCFRAEAKCRLKTELDERLPETLAREKPLSTAQKNNPGSKMCKALGWQVVMGKTFDGSDVCLCEHPSKDLVLCTSLF